MLRFLLKCYRKVLYAIWSRSELGLLKKGIVCTHDPFEEDINHGDVVHPCVRYIPEGYLGHTWWMVYTPYYNANDKGENPILCFGDSESSVPPKHWIVAYQVQGQPRKGYNSDPTLLYDDGRMYVMWRENLTDRCDKAGYIRATFGAEVLENGIGDVFGPLVGSKSLEEDAEVSPTFIKCKSGKYRCYAMHLRFYSSRIQRMPFPLKLFLNNFLKICDILGLCSQQKSYGYSIWESDNISHRFSYKRTIKFKCKNKLYRPWHMDLFENKGRIFAIVQTNQCNADLCLAYSDDYEQFTFYKKPLVTNSSIGKLGIYKPTAGVIDDELFLYYTAQDLENRSLNKLYLSTQKVTEFL